MSHYSQRQTMVLLAGLFAWLPLLLCLAEAPNDAPHVFWTTPPPPQESSFRNLTTSQNSGLIF
jgi:hypothetical protein